LGRVLKICILNALRAQKRVLWRQMPCQSGTLGDGYRPQCPMATPMDVRKLTSVLSIGTHIYETVFGQMHCGPLTQYWDHDPVRVDGVKQES